MFREFPNLLNWIIASKNVYISVQAAFEVSYIIWDNTHENDHSYDYIINILLQFVCGKTIDLEYETRPNQQKVVQLIKLLSINNDKFPTPF